MVILCRSWFVVAARCVAGLCVAALCAGCGDESAPQGSPAGTGDRTNAVATAPDTPVAGAASDAAGGGARDEQDPVATGKPAIDPDAQRFIRFETTGEHEGRLETAIVRYENRDGVALDLVAVVHIGDEGYFDELNRRFDSYDAVLYEMVAPEGADPTQIGRATSPVSMIQRGLCNGLGLAFQLEAVDYSKANFVHADLTTEGFARVWEERNMNFFKLFLQIMSASMGSAAGGAESALTPQAMFEAVRSKNRQQRMKYLLGREFSNLELMFAGGRNESGEDDSILIGERNKAAMRVVGEQISLGRKKLALFYGAGHMADFELRAGRDFAFAKTGVEWLTAWNVAPKAQ